MAEDEVGYIGGRPGERGEAKGCSSGGCGCGCGCGEVGVVVGGVGVGGAASNGWMETQVTPSK